MRLDELLPRLHGVRQSGDGWSAQCPGHDDEHNSLSVGVGSDGRILVYCHAAAGCNDNHHAKILRSLNLTDRDLFNDAKGRRNGDPQRKLVSTYSYHDESHVVLYEVLRYQDSAGGKTFLQRRPDGQGGWIWKLDGVRRVLYRLPELRDQKMVFVVEGERDVETLVALGLSATTNAGGAGKWRPEYTEQLRAAGVEQAVILPDNDAPGQAHALAVARSSLKAALRAKIVELPGLPPKGDVTDWLTAGQSREELAEIASATPWATEADLEGEAAEAAHPGLSLTPLGELLSEPEEEHAWLVEGRLSIGGLSLLAGKPKAGKSTAARCLALAVSRGEPWLGFPTHPGLVFYLGLEEQRAEVRKHFKIMGAGSEEAVRVFIAAAPQDGLRLLREAADRERPALIIVDPLLRLVRVKDANDYAAVMAALEPLLALARETGAHVLATHHLGKGERGGGDAILGSTAIFATVDTALLLKRSDRYRTLSSIQRSGEDLEEITLILDPKTRVVTAGLPRQEADEAEAAGAILAYFKGQDGPVDEASVHEAIEGRRGTKVKALRALVETGQVSRSGLGRRGAPYLYAISSSLVPTYIREPENQKPETLLSDYQTEAVSGSGENGLQSQPTEHPEPESEAVEEVEL